MEIKPVHEKQTPRYPYKEDVMQETLKSQMPLRWTKNAAVKIALGTMAVVSLGGCARTAGVPLPPDMTTEESASCVTPAVSYEQTAGVPMPSETPIITYMPEGDIAPPTLNIAPLFVHGGGMGAFGCQMVAPPVFLSEDEALSVINEVAKNYGLEFASGSGIEFSGVLQPAVNLMEPENTPASDTLMTMHPDFADMAHGVAIEFVSVEDVKGWADPEGAKSSVEQYDTKDAAAQLSDALDEAYSDADTTAGVLYDPCELSEKSEAKSRAMSVEQLKSQAKDFFEWLKNQGVI